MSEQAQLRLTVGAIVQYNCGVSCPSNSTRGRVTCAEILEDGHGRRVWWHVRWFDNETGEPKDNEVRYHEGELEVIEEARP